MTEPDRPVEVWFSIAEARSVAAALDLAAHVLDCCDDRPANATTADQVRELQDRVTNGAVIAELEVRLGRG